MKWLLTIVIIFITHFPEKSGTIVYYAINNHNNSYGSIIRIVELEYKKQGLHQIPVLCYHNITKYKGKEGQLWISEGRLNEQLKILHDSGYHTILPDQLYKHLTKEMALPSKPILLTFDDSHESHFSLARPIMKRYGFKGVFFIMTVCIGKKNYMTSGQIKALSDSGHVIGCHTYDHPAVTGLKGNQWERQIEKPKQTLERITGKPVDYFAYPYGIWNDSAIKELKAYSFKAAFQLMGKQSKTDPLFTLHRLMVSGHSPPAELEKNIKAAFKETK